MSIQFRRSIVAGVIAAVAFLVAHWFDAGVLVEARTRAQATFEFGQTADLMPIAHLVTASGVLAISLAAWWSRSLLVGAAFAVVGGIVVFLPLLFWNFTLTLNEVAPPVPEPIARPINDLYMTLVTGITGSVFTLGGAMLLSGLAVIWSVLRSARATAAVPLPAPVDEPELGHV